MKDKLFIYPLPVLANGGIFAGYYSNVHPAVIYVLPSLILTFIFCTRMITKDC
jgi:hypothetical protein